MDDFVDARVRVAGGRLQAPYLMSVARRRQVAALWRFARAMYARGRAGLPVYGFDLRDVYLALFAPDWRREPHRGYCRFCREGEVWVPGDRLCADCSVGA